MFRVLLIAAGALALVLLGLVGAALSRKAFRHLTLRRRLELERSCRARLLELVADGGRPPAARGRRVRRCEARVAWELLRKLRGDARGPLAHLLEARGEIARARRHTRRVGALRRARAASLLGDAGHVAALPDLLALLSDRDRDVRRVAARALGQLGAPTAVPHLLAALHRRRACPATVVAEALMEIGAPAHGELREGLASPRAIEREIAALALGLTGGLGATADLTRLVTDDPDPNVRRIAGEALGRLGVPSAVPPLVAALGSGAGAEREAAAIALARIGDPRAAPALARALDDPESGVAVHAARGLALLGEREALLARAGSPAAREALERLAAEVPAA